MDFRPIFVSLKTASISIVCTFFLGIALAAWVTTIQSKKKKAMIDGILTLPMVLPPPGGGVFFFFSFWCKEANWKNF